jgi:dinuclear metal center YbgI/SA1388 family protein
MTTVAPLAEMCTYLDQYLHIGDFPDYPNALNGLQVENSGEVARIVAAVDASQTTIDAVAATPGPALLLVHHGLFWDGNQPVTGRRYRRIRTLMSNDTALYSVHLPLDAHPSLGNNILLAHRLQLDIRGWFAPYQGRNVGVWGYAAVDLSSRSALCEALQAVLGLPAQPRIIPGGPERLSRIGIVTGGAGGMIAAARDAGIDTFVTGEGAHHTYFDAIEWGINVVYAGHYATERLGVEALAVHLAERFSLPWEFQDHPTGL